MKLELTAEVFTDKIKQTIDAMRIVINQEWERDWEQITSYNYQRGQLYAFFDVLSVIDDDIYWKVVESTDDDIDDLDKQYSYLLDKLFPKEQSN